MFPASEAFHLGRPSDGGACHRLPLAMRRYYNADCLIRVHQRVRDVKRHIHSVLGIRELAAQTRIDT